MTDTKISGYPAASALGGTEVVPGAQGGATKKITASQISSYVRSQVTKADVGLGNVDNASSAQITALVLSVVTKADVGLSNVDNTSDSAKNSANVTLTNKTIAGGSNTISGIALSSLASQADQTVVANIAGSAAAPTAITAAQLERLFNAGITTTWAARGSGSVVGQRKIISDIGPTAGTEVVWNGTYWRVVVPTNIVFNVTQADGVASSSEQLLMTATLAAGIFRLGRYWSIKTAYGKDATSETVTGRWRLGVAGTTADQILLPGATAVAITTTNRTYARHTEFYFESATKSRALGSANTANVAWQSASSANNMTQGDMTLSGADIDANALILSATLQPTGSSVPSIHSLVLTAFP